MRGRSVVLRRRLRRRRLPQWIRRHRWLYWLASIAFAALTAHAISSAASHAEAARAAWGEARPVLIARHRLDIGDVLAADDVESESWPAALVPRAAVTAAGDAVGRTVVEVIEPGEAVLVARLAPDGLRGVAALIPPGWRALSMPAGPSALPLSVGDRVDVVAAVDGTTDDSPQTPSFVLADNALVVAVDDKSVAVAVRADDAPRLALGIVTGSVVPALRSG